MLQATNKDSNVLKIPDIKNLTNTLLTLKKRVLKALPLLDMRTKVIPLIKSKLTTKTTQNKAKQTEDSESLVKLLYFFDP
jgi:hypothetical protein